jgi:hypothetical protein
MPVQRRHGLGQRRGGGEVELVHHDQVGLGQAARHRASDVPVGKLRRQLLGIDKHDHAIDRQAERRDVLRQTRRLGHARHLDHDPVQPIRPPDEARERLARSVRGRTAHAAVRQADRVALMGDDQPGVDVQRAEIVDDDADALAVVAGQDPVQERRLAGPEVAAKDGDGQRHAGAFQTLTPSLKVSSTLISRSASGSVVIGLRSRMTRSASLPGAMEPLVSSS